MDLHLSVKDRWSFVTEGHLCVNCLSRYHPVSRCPCQVGCGRCHGEHHTTLDPLRSNAAPGWDGLTSEILINVYNQYPTAMTSIYTECLVRGMFPVCWKKSRIVILTKSGKCESEEPSKFRPISLLPVAGKVLEKLLMDRIMHYMNSNHFFQVNSTDSGHKCQQLVL